MFDAKWKWIVRGSLLAAAVMIAWSAWRDRPASRLLRLKSMRSDLNVLLITVDTLRADHLGCYGHERARTPVIDSLAARGARFAQAVAHAPVTLPSHASIMTGTLPIRHGVEDNGTFRLADEAVTLAEVLKQNGYATAAVIGAFVLHRQFGLAQGFDDYMDRMSVNVRPSAPHASGYDEIEAREVTGQATAWIEENQGRRWFLWAHYFDPHAGYDPPPPFKDRFAHPYDGEIACVDHFLGKLFETLERLDLASRTMVILTSDHGEGLGQHNEQTHTVFIYDSTMHVPLIIALPQRLFAPRVVEQQVGLIDVMPTVLDVLGIPCGGSVQGRSLLALAAGGDRTDTPPMQYIESRAGHHEYGWAALQGVRGGGYKFIRAPRPELYDLARDPDELKNLIESEPDRATALSEQLDRMIEDGARHRPAGESWQEMDPETERRLSSLGYVWSRPAVKPEEGATGRDPKDMLWTVNLLDHSAALVAAGQFEKARGALEKVLEVTPANKRCLNRLGDLYRHLLLLDAGRKDEHAKKAIAYFRRAIEVDPDFQAAYHNLALTLNQSGRAAEAVELLRGLIERMPLDATAHSHLGRALYERHDYQDAVVQLTRSIEIYPNFVPARFNLAATYLALKRLPEALEQIQAADRLAPNKPEIKRMLERINGALNNR